MSSSCSPDILNTLNDSQAFYRWIQQKQTVSDELIGISTLSNEQEATLASIDTELQNTLNCIMEQNDSISVLNTQNALTRTEIADKKKELLTRQEDIKIAKDRALIVRHPELSTSYYDGWFPLNRPMHHLSIPILIAFATFLTILSFFMTLKAININTIFTVLVPTYVDKYGHESTVFGMPFMIMAGLAVLFLCLMIYAFIR